MRRELARVLPSLTFLALLFGGEWLLNIGIPAHLGAWAKVAFAAWVLAALVAGTVAHELAHAGAVRLAGEQVLGIELGGRLGRVTFCVGSVPVSVGLGLGGSVRCHIDRLPAARRAAILAAGPATSLLIAPLCLLLPVPRPEAAYLALCMLASGVQDLVPGKADDGSTTDGYKIGQTPARLRVGAQTRHLLADPDWPDRPATADILISGFRLGVPEAEDGLRGLGRQPERLLRVYRQSWMLPDRPDPAVTHIVHVLSWQVLVAGDLPGGTAELAASRLEWVIAHLDRDYPDERTPAYSARHALGLARLRQGRPADVRQLCADALTARLDPDERASVLATVAMARHALLLSGRPQLDEALALDPDADLVGEAVRFLDSGWDAVLAAAERARAGDGG